MVLVGVSLLLFDSIHVCCCLTVFMFVGVGVWWMFGW